MSNTPNDACRQPLPRTHLFSLQRPFESFLSDACRAPALRFRAGAVPILAVLSMLLMTPSDASHAAQTANTYPPGASRRQQGVDAPADPDPISRTMEEQMIIKRTTERQKIIVADTTRLLQLATELKTEVDKSTKDQMSLSVVKKAEEVEKLARTVKEKMKGF